jgi:hypothetical protein
MILTGKLNGRHLWRQYRYQALSLAISTDWDLPLELYLAAKGWNELDNLLYLSLSFSKTCNYTDKRR